MPTNKQRREAARRHLERQLQRRQEREAARKRFTLFASIVGTLVLIAVIVVFIVAVGGDNKKKTPAAASRHHVERHRRPRPPTPSTSYPPATGGAVSFNGVTVKGATDLAGMPAMTSKATTDAAKIEYKDLVVGTGAAATAASTVTVQYVGVLYKTGVKFDSSWARGMPIAVLR